MLELARSDRSGIGLRRLLMSVSSAARQLGSRSHSQWPRMPTS